jgi:hypothetical protein
VRRAAWLVLVLLGAAACADADRPAGRDGPAGAPPAAAPADSEQWPTDPAAGVSLRRERALELTPDAAPETVIVTARGPRYDSLEIRLVIRSARGDTLWADGWNSALYFYYDPVAGKADTTVARIVQAHVDTLLHDSRYASRGLPGPMRHGDYRDMIAEAVRYHLAELDWRNRADVRPAERTPPEAYERIDAGSVAPERVEVVTAELLEGPTFMYYAGGEASYVIGWSVREHGFVRIFSCC